MRLKERLDKILVYRGYTENTSKAKALIMAGKIIVNGKKVEKAGIKFFENVDIRVINKKHQWVSRGGIKLVNAVEKFQINIKDKICADLGASTGGFTEVLLKKNAEHVYCIDVGRGQLDWKLATNNKVTILDKTNARNVDLEKIDKNIEIITCDLSFISIKKALSKIIEFKKKNIKLIALIKPQFELSKDKIGKNGIVTEVKYRNEAVKEISNWLESKNWKVISTIESCITGIKGNQEYFIYSVKEKN
ncbi:MAG: TlyA family rRNA (cytidine-2'-O)-methyltransferase [Pelagibacterales bacterium]|nr:TlyA family rRNA (cytidine-2'-O)-methyltransferase [Pelagibacterales bacterium]OUU61400.1 MAG: hypothetical protein CBC22_07675 [Alphaproteobacteria bacterium TMED62]|tara:strand:- start:3736 stop:4479 length:744 start_codon:yes stop_codon:yes gene_type:complete